MTEAIGKGIASYVSALKDATPQLANKEPIEAVGRRESGQSKSVEVTISQEALNRRKNE